MRFTQSLECASSAQMRSIKMVTSGVYGTIYFYKSMMLAATSEYA